MRAISGLAILTALACSPPPALAQGADPRAEPISLRAEKADIDIERKSAAFRGSVELRRGDLVVRCPALTVRYSEPLQIASARAAGGVTAHWKGYQATAPVAELDAENRLLVLHGGVSVTHDKTTLRADKARVDLSTMKVALEGVRAAAPPPSGKAN